MIRFSCPRCKSVLDSPDQQAGNKIECPKCQQRLQIPLPPRNKTVLGELVLESPTLTQAVPVQQQVATAAPAIPASAHSQAWFDANLRPAAAAVPPIQASEPPPLPPMTQPEPFDFNAPGGVPPPLPRAVPNHQGVAGAVLAGPPPQAIPSSTAVDVFDESFRGPLILAEGIVSVTLAVFGILFYWAFPCVCWIVEPIALVVGIRATVQGGNDSIYETVVNLGFFC